MPSTWFVYLDIVYLLSTYWTYFASYAWVFHCVIPGILHVYANYH